MNRPTSLPSSLGHLTQQGILAPICGPTLTAAMHDQENDILRSWSSMLGTLRECNACLRWLCCHALPPAAPAGSLPLGTGRHKAAAAAQGAAPPIDKLLRLLLDTAVLEHQVLRMQTSSIRC